MPSTFHRFTRRNIARAAVVSAAVWLTTPALAGEGDVEYRQSVYAAIGGHMQAMAGIIRQQVPHMDHLALHATAMADMAGIASDLFPPQSEGGDALPAVWSDRETFNTRMSDFKNAANAFQGAVETGKDVVPAFQALAQSCKSCHTDFRAE